ncbi:MAG: DUF268 domain-containing protein [Bryobacteraceae bacterium]|jgi:hypothetical protein
MPKTLYRLLLGFGLDTRVLLRAIGASPGFVYAFWRYRRLNAHRNFAATFRDLHPVLHQRKAEAGTAAGHYFHQDLWAAQRIYSNRPGAHLDVGSRIDGFIAHLLVFMPVTVIDIRPLECFVPGLSFRRDDATTLGGIPDDSVPSLSSLHVVEHFGLGRYADSIDPDACFTFMRNLQRVLAPGGHLYFSAPIGRERLEFNAHRIFSQGTIAKAFEGLRLESFAYIADNGELHETADPAALPHVEYGCGLFDFVKPLHPGVPTVS